MRSLSTVGLALSLVFGCLLLALVAELYYILWWKKRVCEIEDDDDEINSPRELLHKLCWEKPLFFSSTALTPQQMRTTHNNKDLWSTTYGGGEEGIEGELMRIQGLSGPTRFLFPIKEETKEDLESEEGKISRKGSRSRSLSDGLFVNGETPFLTPVASPPYYTPPMTPLGPTYSHHGINPLFESSRSEVEFWKLRSPSPPPKFKFLKGAEDKLYRKKLLAKADGGSSSARAFLKDEENGSFITLIVAKDKDSARGMTSSNRETVSLES